MDTLRALWEAGPGQRVAWCTWEVAVGLEDRAGDRHLLQEQSQGMGWGQPRSPGHGERKAVFLSPRLHVNSSARMGHAGHLD